jgi:hypothetical protein
MRSGSKSTRAKRFPWISAEVVAAAAAKVLIASAVLGVLIASACAPSDALDRSAAPTGEGSTSAPPGAVVPSEVVVVTEAPDASPDATLDPTVGTPGPDMATGPSVATTPAMSPAPGSDVGLAVDAGALVDVASPSSPPVDAGTVVDSRPATPSVDGAPVIKRVAFLVLNPLDPEPGEWRMRRLLEARGFAVQFVLDTSLPADVAGATLVIISASTRGWMVVDNLRDIPSAILSMKSSVFDDLGMTGPTRDIDYNETDAQDLEILNNGHPLAAGLRGRVRGAEAALAMAWGRPAPAAVRIAGLSSDPAKLGIFAYDTGVMMMTRPAPGRRIGFFATERLAAQWSADAVRLFEAAVTWATR